MGDLNTQAALQDGRKTGHHQGLLDANQQAALREMLVDGHWSFNLRIL